MKIGREECHDDLFRQLELFRIYLTSMQFHFFLHLRMQNAEFLNLDNFEKKNITF